VLNGKYLIKFLKTVSIMFSLTGWTRQRDPFHHYRNPLSHPGPPIIPCGHFPQCSAPRRHSAPVARWPLHAGHAATRAPPRPTACCVPVGHAASPTMWQGFWRRSSSHVRRSLPTARSLAPPIGQSRGASPASLRQEVPIKTSP
jgi:hypothetical protein